MATTASMNALKVAKQQMRKKLKEALKAMSNEARIQESLILTEKLLQCDEYASANRVSIYLPMPVEEVDTTGVIKNLFDSKKSCFVPRFIGDRMDMLQVHSMEDVQSLPVYKWGIKQPSVDDTARDNALTTGGLDLIIVPGLGFTKNGKRLGRGKGFYDRFIGQCRELNGSTKTIALAYSVQVCEDIPTTELDRTIDIVLSP